MILPWDNKYSIVICLYFMVIWMLMLGILYVVWGLKRNWPRCLCVGNDRRQNTLCSFRRYV